MFSSLKKNIKIIIFWLLIILGCVCPIINHSYAGNAPKFDSDFVKDLTDGDWVYDPSSKNVNKDKKLRQNIKELFYPSEWWAKNAIYKVIRDMTLGVMIAFIVWAWASILFNRKPEDVKKTLRSLVYILVWWLFIYGANRIFGSVLDFNESAFTMEGDWIQWVTKATKWIFFVVLSALKAFAFFLAIIMLVITWFRVIAAWEWEKWKKLTKWIINVVLALMIIKWIDFIFYIAEDSANFVQNASQMIVNIAKVFAYIYWVIVVIMVIIAWYLYITDGWSGTNFKKASNVLINILLSSLVLFAFLLILYQVFAEFQTWWDAVTTSFIVQSRNIV